MKPFKILDTGNGVMVTSLNHTTFVYISHRKAISQQIFFFKKKVLKERAKASNLVSVPL